MKRFAQLGVEQQYNFSNCRLRWLQFMFLLWANTIQAQELVACFQHAAAHYQVDVALLVAIAQVESSMRPNAVNHDNLNGSEDYGLMQINSRWLPMLSQYGITKTLLLQDPCANIQVGAWILANNFYRMGLSWSAVGAYNAGTANSVSAERNRRRYIARIRHALTQRNSTDGYVAE